MTVYQHKKGKICDNALQALLHDPLFKMRTEQNRKGKGSYRRKAKNAKAANLEASGKEGSPVFTTGLQLLRGQEKQLIMPAVLQ